jgi:hypothetical protein
VSGLVLRRDGLGGAKAGDWRLEAKTHGWPARDDWRQGVVLCPEQTTGEKANFGEPSLFTRLTARQNAGILNGSERIMVPRRPF